jgi:hypothetical protein
MTTFPLAVLDAEVSLQLTTGTWTSITTKAYQRQGTSPPIVITRGRPNESSSVNPATCTMQWNNRDGRFTPGNPAGPYYGQLNRNTPVRVSVPYSTTYLRMEDDSTSYCYTADSSSLQLTGNMSVRIDCQPANYQPCTLAAKWGNTATAWLLALNGDGTVTFWWNTGSAVLSATSTQPVSLGRVAIRVDFDPNTAGLITFYTAPSMAGAWTQLGAAISQSSTSVSAAAGQSVAAGYANVFQASYPAYYGFQGRIYELLIQNSSGTTVADPQFYNQTAGVTSFTDAQSNTWAVAGTCELSNRSYRFHGEVSAFPQSWDPTGADIWVPVTASSPLRRLQQGNTPIVSAMRRAVTALTTGVVAYWPGEDLQGATQLASGLPGGRPMIPAGPASFAADSTFLCSAAIAGPAGFAWTGPVASYTGTGTVVVRMLCDFTTPPANLSVVANVFFMGGTISSLQAVYGTSPSQIVLTAENAATILASATVAVPQGPFLLSLEIQPDGSKIEIQAACLQPGNLTATYSGFTASSGSQTAGTDLSVMINSNGLMTSQGIGHIWVQDTWTDIATMASAVAAWAGETAANRFTRLCQEYGIAPRVYGFPGADVWHPLPSGTLNAGAGVLMGAQQIDTLENCLQSCEDADHGQVYDPATGFGLGYRTLAALCSQSPGVTFNYAAAQLGDGRQAIGVTDDDQYLINDWTVTRNNGSSLQRQLNDGSAMSISAPPAGVGDYTSSITEYLNTDGQLSDSTGWRVRIGTVNQQRYPVVPLNLARTELSGLFYEILDANIGDYFQITNPLTGQPPGPVRQLMVGLKESLGGYFYLTEWNAAPESPYEVLIAGDVNHGRFDTSGSQLATSYSSTATSFSVNNTGGGVRWTTSAGDFPFYISVAGEQIQVTNITGSSSPQTFSVTRSINGVVKAQASGAAVNLWYPAYAAITTATAPAI